MKKRILTTGTTITLLAALVPASAGEKIVKKSQVNVTEHAKVFRTPGKKLIRGSRHQ